MFKFIKRIYNWLIKSIQYSIVLWNDADWDYVYILQLLQYKLERTRKCLKANNLVVSVDRYCKQIRICELLLERIVNSNYCEKEYDEHFKQYPFRSSLDDKNETNKKGDMFTKIYNKEQRMRQQDYDLLFKILNKHLYEWWD
jgi:hypothetical protein